MSILTQFYGSKWSLPFGASSTLYKIVPGRHIGLDIASTGSVPALLAGTVVRVRSAEPSLGSVVVIFDGTYYWSYCHLSKRGLPAVGSRVNSGDTIGELADGPASLPPSAIEFPGTAWTGKHLHLVCGTHPESAYSRVPGHRTLSAFRDPAPFIRNALSASAVAPPASATPPPFTESEYPDMFVAVVNGSWFLVVPQGNAKPRAAVLGGESQVAKSGLPIIHFTWAPAIAALKRAVDGL